MGPTPAPRNVNEEVVALVRQLQETEQRLQELTGGGVDAVLNPAGESYLLRRAQERLRQNETLLRMAGRTARMGGWNVNLVEPRITWSDEVCAIHEVPAGTVPGLEEVFNYYIPEWRAIVRQAFECCIRDGVPFDLEAILITAKGNRVWVHAIGEAVHDPQHMVTAVQGAFQDITERKSAEEKLRQSERAQHALAATQASILNAISPHIALLDREGVIVSVNDRWRRFSGNRGLRVAPAAVGQNYLEVCEQAVGEGAQDAHLVAAGIRTVLSGGARDFVHEYPCPSPTEPLWFLTRVTCVEVEQRQGAVVAHENITPRKLAEFRMKRVNRLHSVISKVSEAIGQIREAQALYDAVCRILVEDGLLRMAFVAELDADGGRARPVASHGAGREYLLEPTSVIPTDGGPLSQGTVGTALRTGAPDVCNDIGAASRMKPWHESALKHGLRANASFPLLRGGTTFGALVLYAGETDYFLDDELRLMVTVSTNLSVALEALAKEQQRQRADSDLRASEERFRNMFTGASVGIASSTPQGRFLQANAAYCRMLGYTEAELQARDFASLTHPEDLALNLQLRDEMLVGQRKSFGMEKRYLKKDGSLVWTRLSVSATHAAGGEVTTLIVVAEDITERKRAEESVAASADLLRQFVRHAPAAVAMLDTEMRYLQASERWLRDYHLDGRDIAGVSHYEIFPDLPEHWKDIHRRVLAGAVDKCDEAAFPRADGSMEWLQWEVRPWHQPGGEVGGLIMFTQVITARKRTEQALAESEGRYRALIDWSPEAISVQRDGKVIYVNPAGVKLAGVKSAQDLIGRSILDLVHPDSRPVVLERMKKSLTEGVGQPLIEEKLLRPDGTVVIVEIQGTPIIYDGKPALYSSMRDITARRIAEEKIHQLNVELEQRVSERTAELVAANKELEAFSYSVSHDLRAPLRAVDGFSQAVVNDYGSLLPADGLRQLQVIRQGAQRMGALIDDLLSFSRLSRQPLKKQPVDTGQLVRAVLAELNPPGAAGRPVTIRLGELPAGEGDPALLRQVWVNLIANALKYTGKRDQAVVEIGCLAPPEEHVYFVRDNGSGFDMRYAGKLFGVFQRLHRAEDYEGTGVGLAIVQRIVHRHGGRVWAEAAVDRGATFYFTLKAKPQP